MDDFIVFFNEEILNQEDLYAKLFITILAFIGADILSKLIYEILKKTRPDKPVTRRDLRSIHIILIIITLMFVLRIWFGQTQSFALVMTIFSALIALAFKDFIIDIVAFIYVTYKNTFKIGDIVEVDKRTGKVTDMDFLQFDLAEIGDLIATSRLSGRQISIPNRFIFEKPITNWTKSSPFVMQEVSLLVGFDQDRKKGIKLAEDLIIKIQKALLDEYDRETVEVFKFYMENFGSDIGPNVRSEIESNGFRIFVQFFTSFDDKGKNNRYIAQELFDLFEANDIKVVVPNYVRVDSKAD